MLYIGTNNYEAGRRSAPRSSSCFHRRQMACSSARCPPTTRRSASRARDSIKGHKIEIVDKREDNTDRAKARSNVEDIINAHGDLKLVAGLWSYNGPAIASAIEALGKKGKVLAAVFDEEEGALNGIANDVIACTVVQKPFDFGTWSSKWMHELATKPEAAAAILPQSPTPRRSDKQGHVAGSGRARRMKK